MTSHCVAQLVGSICGASIALATTGKGHVIGSVDLPSDMTRDDKHLVNGFCSQIFQPTKCQLATFCHLIPDE